jgi:hypothetical protein
MLLLFLPPFGIIYCVFRVNNVARNKLHQMSAFMGPMPFRNEHFASLQEVRRGGVQRAINHPQAVLVSHKLTTAFSNGF